ncbi:GGDEF domain-containing protein [Streptomyces sp. TRM 70351]|uniref:GGDEF domain-containing protein n=1 Tax=Streptomyces sp. TRM 70351 TaxID=3116552 RepID=UPI002E7C1132|nr:GGDEF domain-containing protein [Streptomyces sp. TRM 70351]MEE1929210.1 GGDEF domain-containing protein [Streptomyces sp. TRM 70351]
MRTAPSIVNGPSPPVTAAPGTAGAAGAGGHCAACGRHLTDGLTGVLDRRSWENRALAELAASRDAGRPVALLLADLDRFKSVNDTYGHLAGDAVLRSVAAVLSRVEGAVVGRYGGHTGDEFLVLLPHTGPERALRLARQAQEGVRAQTVGARTSRSATVALTGQTVSVGVAGCVPRASAEEALFDLLLDCDVALRAAKHAGGDQVRTAPGGGAEPQHPAGERAAPGRGAERPREVRIPLAAFGHTTQDAGAELVLSATSAAHLREVLGRLLDEPADPARPPS